MSILKHQVIQEKLLQQSIQNPFTLIFHLNPIRAKQLTLLKKTLYSKNIRNSHKIVPLRFFNKLNLTSKNKEIKDSFLTNLKYLGGSSCIFFCSTAKEVADILEILKDTSAFLNVGMILNKKKTGDDGVNFTFLSSYDMEVFLKINSSIYTEFLVLFNNTSAIQSIDTILASNRDLLQMNKFNLVQMLSLYANSKKEISY